MADTWPGTVKELTAAVDVLGGRVFREGDDVEGAEFPYLTVLDPVLEQPGLRGDASTLGRNRQIDVNVWQARADEDDALVDAVRDALDGAKANGGRLTVIQTVRVPQPPAEPVTHHTCTVRAGVVM